MDKILGLLNEKLEIKELEVNEEFSKMKIGPMKFDIKKFEIKNIGMMSIMKAKALGGLLKMDTVIITPMNVDAPLFSYDLINAFGTSKMYLELYSTKVNEELDVSKLNEVKDKYNELESFYVKENWYNYLKYNECIYKSAKKKQASIKENFLIDYFNVLIDSYKEAKEVDCELKNVQTKIYVDGLLEKGGPSTDMFVKKIGIDKTRELFYTVLFNVK